MKKLTLLMALVCTSAIASAQRHMSIANLRAVPQMEQITVVDSVVSEKARLDYKYNEYGYISSYVVKTLNDGKWVISKNSYEQDFIFDANGECTSRLVYAIDQNGKRTNLKEKAEMTVENGLRWERFYELVGGKMEVTKQVAYDKWGNKCREYSYRFYCDNDDNEYVYLRRFWEAEYTGKMPSEKHCNYYDFVRTLCASYVEAYRDDHDEAFRVEEAFKTETVKENGKISKLRYRLNSGAEGPIFYENLDKNWKLNESTVYHLTADGKRISRIDYYEAWDRELRLDEYEELEWDNLGRPVRSITHEVWDDGKEDAIHHESTITYYDNVTPTLTIDEMVNGISALYPEDEAASICRFGHVKSMTNTYKDEEIESQTFEYDKNWRIVKSTWEENDEWEKSHGEIYYDYNKDGHIECQREVSYTEEYGETYTEYIKLEYNYDEDGTWIGTTEYDGESINGPWTLWESGWNAKARGIKTRSTKSKSIFGTKNIRKARAAAQRTYTNDDFKIDFSMFEDMSEGFHFFETTNSIGRINGGYEVYEGEVVSCSYMIIVQSSANVPDDPTTLYKDPVAPLEMDDKDKIYEENYNALYAHCQWDKFDGWFIDASGTLTYYASDNVIQHDIYRSDRDGLHVSTTKFHLDDQKRLIKIVRPSGETCEYTYVDDTQNINTMNEYGTLYRFYYSKRNYLNPLTDIESIATEQSAKGIYDLQGRRVQHPSHGLYIVNGKKVLVK